MQKLDVVIYLLAHFRNVMTIFNKLHFAVSEWDRDPDLDSN
jgi:hypothetical protein